MLHTDRSMLDVDRSMLDADRSMLNVHRSMLNAHRSMLNIITIPMENKLLTDYHLPRIIIIDESLIIASLMASYHECIIGRVKKLLVIENGRQRVYASSSSSCFS